MKKLLISIPVFLLCASANADEGFGICNYSKQKVNAVICFGPAILKDTAVNGNIKVVGPLTTRAVQAKSLSVTGSADVQKTEVAGLVEVTGYLVAVGSHFYNGMQVESDKLTLNSTIVGGDIKMDSAVSKPVLTIQCQSSVTGNVIFGSMAGVVQVSDDSSFPGKIQNGVLEFIRSQC